jgi:pimeloyl-ACP methyl ester carboxylesterase
MGPLARLLNSTPHGRTKTAAVCLVFSLPILNGLGAGQAASSAPTPAPLPPLPPSLPSGFSTTDREQVENDFKDLTEKLANLRGQARDVSQLDHFADVALYHKAILWALRYETNLVTNDVALLKRFLRRGQERADALLAGQRPWTTKTGKGLRGFVSAVDGSTQLYGVIVPSSYDPTKPIRLDVVLHGSSKPAGLSEVSFGTRFDEGDRSGKPVPDADFIELHPLGRVENCYRWAGETDVFEAIEATCRNYRIDRDRIVLRGMSMGASGTWHLGLKHPDRFVAIGPYCGYVDTHRFSETPIPNFIKVGPLPFHQEHALHMLDSVDYAANAGVVPAIAAIGDQDVFFQAHVLMGLAMTNEGLQLVNLIARGTGHVIDPATHQEQLRRIGQYTAKGLDHAPRQLRFVTWTLKYNRCHWLELLGLKEHYQKAEIIANASADGTVDIVEARNITHFAVLPPMLQTPAAKLRIQGLEIRLPKRKPHRTPLVFAQRSGGRWTCVGPREELVLKGKRPGVQGPIDDAFTAPFLCVRGTGQPWNPTVGAWAEASLRRFGYEWARYMRGDLPLKDDTAITDADVRTKNLILFGDPGSNLWIRKALPKLPLTWSRQTVRLGNEQRSAEDNAPALICASPLPGAGDHYLVINSGHTFHEQEFATFNYLLFPRLGDWAVIRITGGAETWQAPAVAFPEEVVLAGFFDEAWEQ